MAHWPRDRTRRSRYRSADLARPGEVAWRGDRRCRPRCAVDMARFGCFGQSRMSSPDLKAKMPDLRGRPLPNQSLAELTWFRVGGPAQLLFMPEDEADLAYFLANLPAEIPATVIGLGSNLIVRDGGIAGVVIRLGRGFSDVAIEGSRVRTGTAVPDVKVARAAQEAGI